VGYSDLVICRIRSLALNYSTSRRTLVAELGTLPRLSLGRAIASDILDPHLIIKRTTATSQQTALLKDTAPLDPTWKSRAQHAYGLLLDTLTAYPNCLKVSRGTSTVETINPVMAVLLVFEFRDKLSVSRLADSLQDIRIPARKATKLFDEEVGIHGLLCRVFGSTGDWVRQFRYRTARIMRRCRWTWTCLRSGRGHAVGAH
jgi:hypothetical protein